MLGSGSPRPKPMRRLRVLAIGVAMAALVAVGIAVAPSQTAQGAADAASFDPGNLITDAVFYDGNGTSAGTIQNLLNVKGSACHANGTVPCLKDIKVAIPASAADSYCLAIPATSNAPAASLFAIVGHACSINPAVLVVLVQKEEGLVTTTSPTSGEYEHATGYDCPDSAPCSSVAAGFYRQVYDAAHQFQHYKAVPSSFNFHPFTYNTIAYHPPSTPSCGSSRVYIENYATAGLYDYTPYQPNAAALRNLNGTGDSCSSYGNRNFWVYYNNWFGNTGNILKSSSFESSVAGWTFGTGINRALRGTPAGGTSTAQSGAYYLDTNAAAVGESMYQDAAVKPSVGDEYSGSIWLRSASTTVPLTGKIVLWGLGGAAENSVVPFSVGNSWTQVSTNLIINNPGHTKLRFQIYYGTTGTDLYLDSAEVALEPWQPSRGPVSIASPSFESGLGGWTFTNGFMNRVVYDLPALAHTGDKFLAANTQVAGRSVGLDVAHAPRAGETYTATIWMRSGSGTLPFTGKFAMWALGGSSENAVTTFSVGQTWTPVTVNLPITKAGHTRLRLEVYLGSIKYDLRLDDVSLSANLISNGSFESGVSNFTQSHGTATVTSVAADPTVPGLVAGTKEAELTVPVTGSSAAITVPRTLVAGETYTATLWIRTADPTQTFSGTLALWAMNGTNQEATTTLSNIGNSWTPVQVTITLNDATDTALRVEIYATSINTGLLVDDVQLQ